MTEQTNGAAVRHATDELRALATLIERPPLDDVLLEQAVAVRAAAAIRTLLPATQPGDGEVTQSRTYSDEAERHLAIRSPLNRAIYGAVREYRMGNMADADNHTCAYPLVDLMSNPAPADVSTGEMEMVALTDEIETAILAHADTQTAALRAALERIAAIARSARETDSDTPFSELAMIEREAGAALTGEREA